MEDFYIVLLSNSSIKYYPGNTTARFTTKLPRHMDLAGDWSVALVDIHVPLTFSTVPNKIEDRRIEYEMMLPVTSESGEVISYMDWSDKFLISAGLYYSLEELLAELNRHTAESHIWFSLNAGHYVTAQLKHDDGIDCACTIHRFKLPRGLRKILGFENGQTNQFEIAESEAVIIGESPGNIHSNVPTNLLVYSDICRPYITGDVYTRLLRNVALELVQFNYGGVVSKSFTQPIYVPLICPNFETIEIDLRTPTGRIVPFDYGTLTLTLHFRKNL